jgi:hypothetical protein
VRVRFASAHQLLPMVLGVVTLAAVALLFVQDAASRLFPAGSHAILASFSLAVIACAYLMFQFMRHDTAIGPGGITRAVLLAAAFLFWAANQLWPRLPQAPLINDVAIGLFVLDVFLGIAGWPQEPNAGSFAESSACRKNCCCDAVHTSQSAP